jgi:hypothetical protein
MRERYVAYNEIIGKNNREGSAGRQKRVGRAHTKSLFHTSPIPEEGERVHKMRILRGLEVREEEIV